jgi:VWFA-related protein
MRWLLALALVAQVQPLARRSFSEGGQPTFRAGVHLIVQPVSVKDRNGNPIEGLTAKDFVVTEDGRPQEIAFVEFQPVDDASARAPVTPSAAATSLPSVTQEATAVPRPGDTRYRGRRLLVLYFDLYGMSVADQYRAFTSAQTYLGVSMTASDLLAIMAFKGRGVRLLQDFTDDRDALRRVLGDLTKDADEQAGGLSADWDPGGAFGEDDDTFNLFTVDRQLAAVQTAVSGLAGLPEVKTLIYFGGGLRTNGTENLAQLRATVNAAIRANVTLNPIDARGLVAMAPLGDAKRPSPGGIGMFSGALAEAATTRFQRSQDTLYALAKDTGGKALLDNNDLSLGIVQAARAVTGYYLIGYYTNNTDPDGKYRRVKVSLTVGLAAELSYRPGYYANKVFAKFTAADRERQLADALRLEDPITEIPMALEVNYFQVNSAEYFVPVSIRMPGSELTRTRGSGTARVAIDMIGELKDEHGVTHRNVRDKIEIPSTSRSIQYETAFTVLPGTYVLKVLARDDTTGRIGTFQSSFTIPNLEREQVRLRISSVVLASQRVGAASALFNVKQRVSQDVANPLVYEGRRLVPSVTRTFSARQPLFVFLQAYEQGAASMRPVVAFVTIYRGREKVFETEPTPITDGFDPKSAAVPVRLTVSLRSLQPGMYDCQVSVLDPASPRAAFWRAPIVVIP